MLHKNSFQVRRLCLLISLLISAALCTHHSSASDTTGLVTKLTGDFVMS